MASYRTTALHTYRRSHYRRQNSPNVTVFALAVILISTTALFGCGGGISTTEQQGNSTPGTETGTGAATLTWAVPTTNTDGSPLTDLAGYKVYYGTAPDAYTAIVVGNITSYQIDGLTKGKTYYFTVTAYDATGLESDYAPVAIKLIS